MTFDEALKLIEEQAGASARKKTEKWFAELPFAQQKFIKDHPEEFLELLKRMADIESEKRQRNN